jgi:hypothetical protein
MKHVQLFIAFFCWFWSFISVLGYSNYISGLYSPKVSSSLTLRMISATRNRKFLLKTKKLLPPRVIPGKKRLKDLDEISSFPKVRLLQSDFTKKLNDRDNVKAVRSHLERLSANRPLASVPLTSESQNITLSMINDVIHLLKAYQARKILASLADLGIRVTFDEITETKEIEEENNGKPKVLEWKKREIIVKLLSKAVKEDKPVQAKFRFRKPTKIAPLPSILMSLKQLGFSWLDLPTYTQKFIRLKIIFFLRSLPCTYNDLFYVLKELTLLKYPTLNKYEKLITAVFTALLRYYNPPKNRNRYKRHRVHHEYFVKEIAFFIYLFGKNGFRLQWYTLPFDIRDLFYRAIRKCSKQYDNEDIKNIIFG